jgi:predicted double-glycine peptidase
VNAHRLVGLLCAAAAWATSLGAAAEPAPAAPPPADSSGTPAKSATDQFKEAQRAIAARKTVRLANVTLPSDNQISEHVTSYAELRFRGIVRQTLDLSCGAAALATLLKGYLGLDIDEATVIDAMLNEASPENAKQISQAGFSMLELKHFAESRGLVAGGFRTDHPEELRKLRAPVLALINSRGYNHFVVVRHVWGDEVAIADPVFGNRTEPLKKFAKRWNNVILVVVAPGRPVNAAFMQAPPGAVDPRAVQLFLSRSYAPALGYGPGDYY